MIGDKITAKIEKHRDPCADGFNWLREQSAKAMLKFVHGVDSPARIEDEDSITFFGVATIDPPKSAIASNV